MCTALLYSISFHCTSFFLKKLQDHKNNDKLEERTPCFLFLYFQTKTLLPYKHDLTRINPSPVSVQIKSQDQTTNTQVNKQTKIKPFSDLSWTTPSQSNSSQSQHVQMSTQWPSLRSDHNTFYRNLITWLFHITIRIYHPLHPMALRNPFGSCINSHILI